jgi:DNA-binding CsgD family transcriptional regulator
VPPPPGVVLFNVSNRPVYFNREAIQILSYPRGIKNIDELAQVLPPQVMALLENPRAKAWRTDFLSGRRHYTCRLFSMANNSHRPAEVLRGLLLERSALRSADITTVAQQFQLTSREQQTAELLMEGLTSKEIASRMMISPNTVKTFVRILMMKTEASTRSGIVGKLIRCTSAAPLTTPSSSQTQVVHPFGRWTPNRSLAHSNLREF